MELRQLRNFAAVAEIGNISRAAEKVFLTQPALSRQIKALEDEIGRCLLERRPHSIKITPAGEILLREARELLLHADRVLERVRAGEPGMRLRVGYAPSLASGMLSAAVENFNQLHPGARVELFDLSTAEMLAGLEGGKLDIAVTVGDSPQARGLKWTSLVRAPWRLAVGRKHPFARRKAIASKDLAREPLLVFCQRDYPEYWEIVTGWLREHRVQAMVAGEYDGSESLMAAVESGLGVALVTTRTAHLFRSRAHFKAVSDGPGPLCIAAARRADQGDAQPFDVFIEDLRLAAGKFA